MSATKIPDIDIDSTDEATTKALFEMTMRNFNAGMHHDGLKAALHWAHQLARITAVAAAEEHISGTREAYAALVLTAAAKFEAHALHCGNITDNHVKLAAIINEAADGVVEHVRTRGGVGQMVAMTMQGYAKALNSTVQQIDSDDDLPTSGSTLDIVFASFDPMVEFARGLIRAPDNFGLTPDEKVMFAATALQNCAGEVNWLLPSDYEKAAWYVKRSLELLAIDPPSDRPGLHEVQRRAIAQQLQGVVDEMPKLLKTLAAKNYRESKRSIKLINAAFEAYAATRRF